jgi:hypothetical protein
MKFQLLLTQFLNKFASFSDWSSKKTWIFWTFLQKKNVWLQLCRWIFWERLEAQSLTLYWSLIDPWSSVNQKNDFSTLMCVCESHQHIYSESIFDETYFTQVFNKTFLRLNQQITTWHKYILAQFFATREKIWTLFNIKTVFKFSDQHV